MRIGMEASPLIWERTGIQNYILGLVSGISALERGHELILYTNRPLPDGLGLPPCCRVSVVDRPHPRFQIWFQTALPLRMTRDRLDLFHGTFYRLPAFLPVPGVLTVHDLSGLVMPGAHLRKTRMIHRAYPLFVRKAAGIIAVSAATAAELARRFPGAEAKTVVVHEAADPRFVPVTDPTALGRVRERYALPERFILFLGTLEPRKNLKGLLEAFAATAGDIPHHLVIAGAEGWLTSGLRDRAEEGALQGRVRFTGYVDGEDLPALLSLCEVFVYPSLYEGFGLPVLEAMACGAPVVTSSVSSLPEVAGDAALLADPASPEELAGALLRLASDPALRQDLSRRGVARASRFSWERAARETLEVYERVAGRIAP